VAHDTVPKEASLKTPSRRPITMLIPSPRALELEEQKSDTQGYLMPAKLKREIQRDLKSFNHLKARMWLVTDMGLRTMVQNSSRQ